MKPYIPPTSRNIIKDDTWYIKEKGNTVEINHTKIKNMQKRYGRAKRKLTALEQGLIKPEELSQTPEQLQRTVDRLTVKPYVPFRRNGEAGGGAEPITCLRESAFKRLFGVPVAQKRKPVLERLGPCPVDRFAPSTSGIKPTLAEPEAKRIKSDPTPKKGV